MRHDNLPIWIFLWFSGLLLFTYQSALFELTGCSPAFFGLILFSASVVGLSTHLATYVNQEKYDLWKKLKPFLSNHKFLTSCAGLGTVMANPAVAMVGAAIALTIEYARPDWLEYVELNAFKIYDYLKTNVNEESLKSLKKPSFIAGSLIGLIPFLLFLPSSGLFLFNLMLNTIGIVHHFSSPLTHLARGFIPYLGIMSLSIPLTATTVCMIPVSMGLAGGYFGLKTWDKIKSLLPTKPIIVPKFPQSLPPATIIEDPIPAIVQQEEAEKFDPPFEHHPVRFRANAV